MDKDKHFPTRIEVKEIYELARDDPDMTKYLTEHKITRVVYIQPRKSAIFFVDGETEYYDKYFVMPPDENVRNKMAMHTIRCLESQLMVRHIPGVQGIRIPRFHKGIVGLLKMEYVPGQSLGNPDKTEALRDPDELYRLFLGLGKTLAQIHRLGIMHRDIKPMNLLYDSERLVIIDWDQATSFLRDHMDRSIGRIMGTAGYAHFEGERSVDFGAAALSLLKTMYPDTKVLRVYLDEDDFIKTSAARIGKKSRNLKEMFLDYLNRDPEYEIQENRIANTKKFFEERWGMSIRDLLDYEDGDEDGEDEELTVVYEDYLKEAKGLSDMSTVPYDDKLVRDIRPDATDNLTVKDLTDGSIDYDRGLD